MSTLNSWVTYKSRYDHITIKFKVRLLRFRNGREEALNITYLGLGEIFICGEEPYCCKYSRATVPVKTAGNVWIEKRLRGLVKQFQSQGWVVDKKKITHT